MNNEASLAAIFQAHLTTIEGCFALIPQLNRIGQIIKDRLNKGGKILLIGNGGSAADAQHIAAELVGRFSKERAPLAAIALTTDTSILTCLANDYHFDTIFSRQVEALAKEHDILLAFSTSGQSPNIIKAVNKAIEHRLYVVGFTGLSGGELAQLAHDALIVPSTNTARIQEAHILLGHALCELIES